MKKIFDYKKFKEIILESKSSNSIGTIESPIEVSTKDRENFFSLDPEWVWMGIKDGQIVHILSPLDMYIWPGQKKSYDGYNAIPIHEPDKNGDYMCMWKLNDQYFITRHNSKEGVNEKIHIAHPIAPGKGEVECTLIVPLPEGGFIESFYSNDYILFPEGAIHNFYLDGKYFINRENGLPQEVILHPDTLTTIEEAWHDDGEGNRGIGREDGPARIIYNKEGSIISFQWWRYQEPIAGKSYASFDPEKVDSDIPYLEREVEKEFSMVYEDFEDTREVDEYFEKIYRIFKKTGIEDNELLKLSAEDFRNHYIHDYKDLDV